MTIFTHRWLTNLDIAKAIQDEEAHYGADPWNGWREWRIACLNEDNNIIRKNPPTNGGFEMAAMQLNHEVIKHHMQQIAGA